MTITIGAGARPGVAKVIDRPDVRPQAPLGRPVLYPSMQTLRRALYLQAAVWSVTGLAFAVAPRFVRSTLFGETRLVDDAWIRVVGIQAFGLALFMVLVGHRIPDSWWWSWGFTVVTSGLFAVAVLNAAFGLSPGESRLLWWLFAGIALLFAFWLLYGLYRASGEQPIP